MDALSPNDEGELVGAVKSAVALVKAGSTPDEAVEKVARDKSFGPGKIKLVCAAYNTGCQTAQFEANKNILDKLAEFPLADAENVTRKIYGSHEKTSATHDVDPSYQLPPPWVDADRRIKLAATGPSVEKQAAHTPEPLHVVGRTLGDVQRAKHAAEENRRKSAAAMDYLRVKIAELVDYFRQPQYARLPFETVEKAASVYLGTILNPLLNDIYAKARLKEARAGEDFFLTGPLNLDAPPFSQLRQCVKLARDINAANAEYDISMQKQAQAQEAVLAPFAQGPCSGPPGGALLSSPTKEAALLPAALGGAMGTIFTRSLGGMPKPKSELVDDAVGQLESPQHLNELRKIKTQAMLNQMMTDADDPISGYSPDQVLAAFNEISQMTPRLADQPGALRPALRRHLLGKTEPFEAKEMTDIEKGLAGTRMPSTNIMGNGNGNSLLG